MTSVIEQHEERPAAARQAETRGASSVGRAGAGRFLISVLLIAVMAIGSILMWLVIPAGWLWVGSQLQQGATPTLGPYLLVLAGIPISMVIVGKTLAQLDRVHATVTGKRSRQRVHLPWHKSMRGERGSGHERTVLDVVMIASVSLALLAFGVWFFAFAGSSMPT